MLELSARAAECNARAADGNARAAECNARAAEWNYRREFLSANQHLGVGVGADSCTDSTAIAPSAAAASIDTEDADDEDTGGMAAHVQQFHEDGRYIKTHCSCGAAAAAIRVNNENATGIRRAAQKDRAYAGFRWLLLDRVVEDPKAPRELPPAKPKPRYTAGFVAKIDKAGGIVRVYANQRKAQQAMGLARSCSISNALDVPTVTAAGYRWRSWDACTAKEHEVYFQAGGTLPARPRHHSGRQVRQVHVETESTVRVFPSVTQASHELKTHHPGLVRAVNMGLPHRGSLWANPEGAGSAEGNSAAEVPDGTVAAAAEPSRRFSGPKIQTYSADGRTLIKTYGDKTAALQDPSNRELGVAAAALTAAIPKRTLYKGSRWARLERHLPDDTVQAIGDTVEDNQHVHDWVAILNLQRTKILLTFADQKLAAAHFGYEGAPTISMHIKGQRSVDGHYFYNWSACSEELRAKYRMHNTLPPRKSNHNSIPYTKLHAVTGEVVFAYPSLAAAKIDFPSPKNGVKHAAETGDVFGGYKWRKGATDPASVPTGVGPCPVPEA
jgi:hypothetical protein